MSNAAYVYLFLGLYMAVTLAVSLISMRGEKKTPDDYFLSNRGIGTFVLFFTLVATNFSAFFFLGFAGAGYRTGYAYYGPMAFGTALVALAFYIVGYRAWRIARQHNYITPPELIGKTHGSTTLEMVYLVVMVVFTLPYLALQPIGAGYLLANLTDGQIPYFLGATLLTAFIVLYVYLGGMRTVAWTDVIQGVLMFILITAAVWAIANAMGGIGHANQQAFNANPELFSHSGVDEHYSPQRWFSFTILWFLSVAMFPQIFMRFFIPRTSTGLKTTIVLYPVVTAVLFLFPITIGVLGHVQFPGLTGKEADQILPLMLGHYTPFWFEALVMVGAIAAFMSTMDSQLLALSSILTRDLAPKLMRRRPSLKTEVMIGRALVAALAIAGLTIAYQPPATILNIATQAFSGMAVLFPATVATLYWPRTNTLGCIISIVLGECLVFAFYFQWLPAAWTLGFLPVIPIVVIAAAIVVVSTLMSPRKTTTQAATSNTY